MSGFGLAIEVQILAHPRIGIRDRSRPLATIEIHKRREKPFIADLLQPCLELIRPAASLETFTSVKSNSIAVADNNWTGANRQRYANPAVDSLIDRYLTTIPPGPRLEVLKEAVHFITDQLVFMGLIFDPPVLLIAKNLKNVPPANLWNAHEWDLV